MKLFLVVAVTALALFQSSQSVPFGRQRRDQDNESDTSKCATRCSGLNSRFKYEPGKAYLYSLDSETQIQLGSSQTQTTVSQNVQVIINVQSDCEFSLQILSADVQGADVPSTWQDDLQQNPLRFSFDDGRIDNVCPSEDEPVWALNIKRAILSTFQNALESHDDEEGFETDVSGRCPTEYENSESGSTLTIKRRKDLVACRQSQHLHGSLRPVPYDIQSKLQNTPLLNSEQTCEHSIESRRLQSAQCTETHAFQPFDKNPRDGAIQARVVQNLNFQQEKTKANNAFPQVNSRKSLAFDHSEFEFDQSSQDPQEAAQNNIQNLCLTSQQQVQPETPGYFSDLVYNVRRLDQQQLKAFYEQVKGDSSCDDGERFVLEALPMCGTDACVKLMVQLINGNKIDQTSELAWYASFALVSRPNKQILQAVEPLMDRAPAVGLLGISSMTHSYCRQNPNCGNVLEVQQIVAKIESRLGQDCQAENKDEIQEIIYALKALGNIGHVESFVQKVIQCAQNQENPTEIRTAALESLRRQQCEQIEQQQITNIYLDESENTEVRIAAFVQTMRCPTLGKVDQVIEQLKQENSNQVGAYVWSFLNSKRQTNSPNEQELSSLLNRRHIDQKFNLDPRKYSRFTELGYLNHGSNMGAQADASLIFTPEGYLPRQASLNFTVYLFGQSINLFEIGGRAEGIEKITDKLFGPDGYFTNPNSYLFREQDTNNKHKNGRIQNLQDLWENRPRSRFQNNLRQHLAASAYVKIFGDELAYYGFKDLNMIDEIKQFLDIEKMLQRFAEQRDIQVRRNVVFLETTATIPTVSGLPLRLAVNGTASLDLTANGKADLQQIMTPPHQFHIHGHLKPSAAIEIAAMMGIQTGQVRQGVKMIARMHTSTNFKGEIKFADGQVYTAKVELPDEKMEIFDIQSEMYQVVNNRYQLHPQQDQTPKSKRFCSPQQLGKITGLKVCAQAEFSKNPIFYPFRATVTLEKHDKSLNSYEFQLEGKNQRDEKKLNVRFDTPGSEVQRRMEAKFAYKPEDQQLSMKLHTPQRQFDIESELNKLSQGHYDANVKLTVDKNDQYQMQGTFKDEQKGDMQRYELSAEAQGEGTPARIESALEYNFVNNQKAKMSLNIDNIFNKPVDFRTEWALEAPQTPKGFPKYIGKVHYEGPQYNAKFDTHLIQQSALDYDMKMEAEYQKVNGKKHNFLIEGKQVAKMSGSNYKFEEKAKFETSLFPQSAIDFEMHAERQNQKYINNLKFGRANHKPMEIKLNAEKKSDNLYEIETEAKCDTLRLDHSARVQYQNNLPQRFFAKAEIDTPHMKDIIAEVNMQSEKQPKWTMDANANLKYPGREITAVKTIRETDNDQYKMHTELQWNEDKKAELDSQVTLRNNRDETEYTVETTAKISGQNKQISLRKHYKSNDRESTYEWKAQQGMDTLYDLRYEIQGQDGQEQKLNALVKSDYFSEEIDYEVTGRMTPDPTQTQVQVNINRNGQNFASVDAIVPKFQQETNERQIMTELKWNQDTTEPAELTVDWRIQKTNQRERKHDIKGAVTYKSKTYQMEAKVEKNDYYKMNLTVNQDSSPVAKLNLGLKHNEGMEDTAFDMELMTDKPLQKRDTAGRVALKFKQNEYHMLVDSECRISNNKILIDVHGTKKPEGDKKVYRYILNAEMPGGLETHIDQQLRMKDYTYASVDKYEAKHSLIWKNGEKKIENEMRIERTPTGLKGSNVGHTPFEILSDFDEQFECTHNDGDYVFNYHLKYNKNKQIKANVKAINKPNEKKFDIKLGSTFENAKKVHMGVECQKEQRYWSCNLEKNVNDNYKLNAYQEASENRQKLGFDVDYLDVTKSKGHVKLDSNNRNQKYNGEMVLHKDNEVYKIAADINGDKETATVKIQTPNQELQTAKLAVTKTGKNQYQLQAERNGETTAKVDGEVRMDENNKRIRLRVSGLNTPFQVLAHIKNDDNTQKALVEVTMEEEGVSKPYKVEVEYTKDGDRLSGAKIILKHPKREMYAQLERPDQHQIKINFQPNVGANRAPTKIHMRYQKDQNQLKFEGRLSDPSLHNPVKTSLDMQKSGECQSQKSCQIEINYELDYAGNPEKTITKKLRLSREIESSPNPRFGKTLHRLNYEFHAQQPSSNLHIKLWQTLELLDASIPVKYESAIEFKNVKRDIVKYQTKMEYKPSRTEPSALIRVDTPQTYVKLEVRCPLQQDQNQIKFYLYQGDVEPSLVATLTFSLENKIAEFEVRDNENGDVNLHASAKMIDQYTAAVKVWHSENGRRLKDADVKVELDRSNLLKTRFFVRPAVRQDIDRQMSQLKEQLPSNANNQQLKEALLSLTQSQRYIMEDISTEMQPLVEGWKEEQQTLAEELGQGYQDMVDNIQIWYELAVEVMWASVDVVNQFVEQIIQQLPTNYSARRYYEQTKEFTQQLPEQARKMMEPLGEMGKTIVDSVQSLQDKTMELSKRFVEEMKLEEIRQVFQDLATQLNKSDMIEGIIDYLKQLSEKMSLEGVQEYLEQLKQQYIQYQEMAQEYYEQYKDQVQDFARENGLNEMFEPMVEPFGDMDIQKRIQDFIKYLRGQISGEQMAKNIWQNYTPRVTVNEPRKGRYEMEIPLPMKANSLGDLVDQFHPERLNALRQSWQQQVSDYANNGIEELSEEEEELGYSIYDTIHKYKPSTYNVLDMVPPFKSTAYLVGNQHVVTFDGHVYDFKAGCEYLLARDFQDGRFTMTAKFGSESGQAKLEEITTEFAQHKISLHKNGKVEIDSRPVQLPWQKVDTLDGNTLVQILRNDHTTELITYDGIVVACDAYYQVCRVTLPGRYHGQSAGIFGSNDNEPLNDFDLVDGSDNDDLDTLADHWSVEGSCQTNEAHTNKKDSEQKDCRRMFKSGSSPLRPCFRQVAPGPYHEMCLRDMSQHMSSEQAFCNVTAAYIMTCNQIGVQLQPPTQCVRCQSPENGQLDSEFTIGEEQQTENGQFQGHSDVVMVVEERMCLKHKKQKIQKLAIQIAKNDRNSRFGWIGFGGEGVHYNPHMHTAQDSLLFHANKIEEMVKGQKFEPESDLEEPQNDPMQAVLFAVEQFPFRPAVQKTIVLVTCQLCNYGQIDHYTLQQRLLNQGIVLHVLTTQDIETKDDTDDVAGFDAQHLFDSSALTTGERTQLTAPNDVCAVIAQETYGSVFNLNEDKAAADHISKINREQQEQNECQICMCDTNEAVPKTQCTPCDIVQPASLKSQSFTGIADFFRNRDSFLL